jgi:peptide/nickel transport system substrate-binding protein
VTEENEMADVGFQRFEAFLDAWSRRRFLRGMGAAAALTVFMGAEEFLAACSSGAPSSSTGRTPVRGGHLIEGSDSDVGALNPLLWNDTPSLIASNMLFDGLLTSTAEGDAAPLLAKSLPTVSADGRTYTFNLRQDATWTDGKPVTSADVVFTYRLMYDPIYKDVPFARRAQAEQNIQSVTAPDPYTVVITTKTVYAPLILQFGLYGLLPEHVLGQMSGKEIATAAFNQVPNVTNGVFKFVRWDKGQQITFARNETYYRGAAHLDSYVFKILGTGTAVADQLRTGEADIGYVEPSALDTIRSSSNLDVKIFTVPTLEMLFLQLDPAKPVSKILGDKAVRKALYTAIDRQALVDGAGFKQGQAAKSFYPPAAFVYNDGVQPTYTYDRAKAGSMLDAAGWKPDSSGVRQKDGVRMSLEFLGQSGNKTHEQIFQIVQQQWKQVGVNLTSRFLEFQQYISAFFGHDFQVLAFTLTQLQDPDGSLSVIFNSSNAKPGGANGGDYQNPQLDALMDQANAVVDRDKRKALYAKVQDVLADDLPYLGLFFEKRLWGVNKRVGNLAMTATYAQYWRPWMKDVFVTDGK